MDQDLLDTLDHDASSTATGATGGSLVAGLVRAVLLGMKKGAVTAFVRKQSFMQMTSQGKQEAVKIAVPSTGTEWKHYSLKMLKNGLLGVAVFGTYEAIAYDWFGSTDKRILELAPLTSLSIETPLRSLVAGSTPVVVHAGAGACAGVAHSGVTLVWDVLQPRLLGNGKHKHSVFHHWPQKTRLLMQHSIGYASLFGTFEATRRLFEYSFFDLLSQQEQYVQDSLEQLPEKYTVWMKHENGTYDIIPVRMLFTLLAGGIAGQVHHVVREVVANPKKLHVPTIRSTLPSFWMMGLCFAAFEFGGDIAERLLAHKTTNVTLQKS